MVERTEREDDILLGRLEANIENLTTAVRDMKEEMHDSYVTQKEFTPVRTLVYGIVGIMLVAVVGGLVATIMVAPGG